MTDDEKNDAAEPLCKFKPKDTLEGKNVVREKRPANLEEWVESTSKCTDLFDQRLNEIESEILKSSDGED